MATNKRIQQKKNTLSNNDAINIDFSLHGVKLKFATTWGLFSPKCIDSGSKMLLDSLALPVKGNVLDLGCGYGALGLSIAKLSPDSTIHLVDKDFVAINYCQKNIVSNELDNAICYLSNGLSHVDKSIKFTLVVCNLPAKVGNELLEIFFENIAIALVKGGKLIIVCLSRLKPLIKRLLAQNNDLKICKKINQSKHYVVLESSKLN